MKIVLEPIPKKETLLDHARATRQKWDAAGATATQEARARLRSKGIGVVYGKDGTVIEELPDGTIRPLNDRA
ncbi:hypothetical protein [Armatimonas sp.]|uniref:hypothetical protein n=1 Tax=Armatimonas sp. TaxID=1872638 RepID=UPI00286D4C25|nr:hypothetical protein [Armatimonas sp.]